VRSRGGEVRPAAKRGLDTSFVVKEHAFRQVVNLKKAFTGAGFWPAICGLGAYDRAEEL
jgi:hypothetical protein